MRKSKLKTPLAVLRTTIGLKQKQLAALVNKSQATIQSIELGRLKLSETLAERIVLETDVNLAWLLNGDPDAPIIKMDGRTRYSKHDFETAQASHENIEINNPKILQTSLNNWTQQLATLSHKAFKKQRFSLLYYRTKSFLDALEKEFG